MGTKIAMRGITKRFPGVTVVKDLDMDIDDGSFTTLLGPSGCGKTTTLRMIAGLEEADAGEIYIDDKLVFSAEQGVFVPPFQRKVGLIFQSYALWPHMTVGQNISFGMEKRVDRHELQKRVIRSLEQVHLQGLEGRYPSELSGGQQQRVALARTLVTEPEILLMDEPLSNLDAKLRTQMRAELKRIHEDLDITMVYVTHDQIEGLTLSTKIAVMNEGIIEQYSAPDEVYRHPETVFVAEFVGSPQANLLPGRVVRAEGRTEIEIVDGIGGRLALPADFPQVDEVLLGVRPEDLRLSRQPSHMALKATVYAVLPTGADLMVHVRLGEEEIVVREDRQTQVMTNEELWLEFDPENVNVFDQTTNRLIARGLPNGLAQTQSAQA